LLLTVRSCFETEQLELLSELLTDASFARRPSSASPT